VTQRPSLRRRFFRLAKATHVSLAFGTALVGAALSGPRVRRFVVTDRSMEPTLRSGQGLIGWRSNRARVGQLRCFEHPQRPGFWMVKRVAGLPDETSMIVRSDNRTAPTVDSGQFGPVSVAGSSRVIARVPLRWM
jgi:Signal peptidase, peptidase S26